MKDSQYESVYDFLPFFVCAITFAHVCACMPYSYSHKHNTKVQIDIPGVYIQLHNNKSLHARCPILHSAMRKVHSADFSSSNTFEDNEICS